MNLKSLFTTVLFFALFITASVAQSPIGIWKTIDDETNEEKSHVEIYEEGGKLHGKIVKLLPGATTDVCGDCGGARKDKPLVGMKILWDMKPNGDDWKGGTIFSPTKDKEYGCKLWLDDGNNDVLKVRGYVAFIYRTQTWYRVK